MSQLLSERGSENEKLRSSLDSYPWHFEKQKVYEAVVERILSLPTYPKKLEQVIETEYEEYSQWREEYESKTKDDSKDKLSIIVDDGVEKFQQNFIPVKASALNIGKPTSIALIS